MKRTIHLTLALGTVALLALLLTLAMGVQPAALADGNTIKVPDDHPTIQAAIDAMTDGGTILVAADIYKENLSITKGITLSGGWNISFTNRTPGMSVIDGQGSGRVISITASSGEMIVTVDGFTVRNGNANGLGGVPASVVAVPELARRGAADPAQSLDLNDQMAQLSERLADVVDNDLCPYSAAACQAVLDRVEEQIGQFTSSQIEPVLEKQNAQQAVDCGGGIYSWNAGLHLFNSTIRYNIASLDGDGSGGGVCVVQAPPASTLLANNHFKENFATSAHSATGEGGGLYVLQSPGTVIEDNHFSLNTASNAGLLSSGIGGGLMLWASPDAIVEGNEVIRNTANAGTLAKYGLGGGVYVGRSDGVRVAENSMRENLAVVHGGCAGGGLMVNGSDGVVVADNEVAENVACFFQADMAGTGGGGMSLYGINAISVTGNLVRDNVAVVSGSHIGFSVGGGLDGENWFSASQIADNTFARNVANLTGRGWGGGVSIWGSHDAEVTDNSFIDNVGSAARSSGIGGGLFLQNTMNGSVLRNHFQGNLAAREEWGDGGGMAAWQEGPKNFDLTIDANTFLENQASVDRPAASSGGACTFYGNGLTFTNNLIVGNKGNSGVYLPLSARSTVVNNTLVGNQGAGVLIDQANRSSITLTNNIIVSHTVGISVTEGATATVRYTLWDGNGTDIGGGGTITHTHPVSGDPAFVAPSDHDYHLTIASAARDAGDPVGVPPAPASDRDGVARPQGVAVDIGAYEWQGHYQYLPLAVEHHPSVVGWAVGDEIDGYGTILHTIDGGDTWSRQGSVADIPAIKLREVSAVDAENAWVVGNDAILRTRDGGQTWEVQTLPSDLPAGFELQGIKALDANTVVVVGTPSVLLQTTDGITWSRMLVGADVPGNIGFQVVDAVDAQHVWAVGSIGARTKPVIAFYNGIKWHLQPTDMFTDPNTTAFIGVSAIDQQHAWAVGGFSMPLVTTTDGGGTWKTSGHPLIAGGDMNRVVALNPTTGWISGDYGNVKYTTDAGATWYGVSLPSAFLFGITAMDDKTAWVVGPGVHGVAPGIIARTSDAQHWDVQSDPSWPNMSGISFVGARR